METYFENIPGFGDLSIEHIFYEYSEPILFVCLAQNRFRFLCSCCRLSEKWVVTQLGEQTLIDVIDEKISLSDAFQRYGGASFLLSWNGEQLHTSLCELPENLLPKEGVFLGLSSQSTMRYKEYLQKEMRRYKLEQSVNIISKSISKSLISSMELYSKIDFKLSAETLNAFAQFSKMSKELLPIITKTQLSLMLYCQMHSAIQMKTDTLKSKDILVNSTESLDKTILVPEPPKKDSLLEPSEQKIAIESQLCLAA